MAKGRLFSGRNGRRDWDEPEDNAYDEDEYDEYEEEEDEAPAASGPVRNLFFSPDEEDDETEYEDEEEEDEAPKRRSSILSSAKKLFGSRHERDEEDEDEDEDEEDEEEEEKPRRRKKGFALPHFRNKKKSEKADYDFDYDDMGEKDTPSYDESPVFEDYAPWEETAAAAEEPYFEESDTEIYEELPEGEFAFDENAESEELYYEEAPNEAYYEEVPAEEYAEEYYEELPAEEYYEELPAEDYAVEEESVVPEAEESYDPFAALSQRAANPGSESYGGYAEAYEESAEPYDEDEGYYDEDGDYTEETDEVEDYDDFDAEPKKVERKRSGARGGFLMPALSVIALCAVGAIAFATVTLLGSPAYESSAKADKSQTPVASQEPMSTHAPTDAELQAMGLATPAPGNEESKVKAKLDSDGRIVPNVGGSVVPARSLKRSNDDFAGSAMIGNSFVEGMNLWSEIDTLKYICADGVNLDNMIGNYLYYVTVQNYDSIYLCLGLNEIGWGADTFIKKYEKVIDYIRSDGTSKTKNATIYIVSVMPVEEVLETIPGESGTTISLSTIREFNERLKTMCQEKGCWYLDVYSALANDKGYLPDSIAADDHVHFEKTGYRIWTDYLRNHYVDDQLLGE